MNDLDLLKLDLLSETQRCAELFNSGRQEGQVYFVVMTVTLMGLRGFFQRQYFILSIDKK